MFIKDTNPIIPSICFEDSDDEEAVLHSKTSGAAASSLKTANQFADFSAISARSPSDSFSCSLSSSSSSNETGYGTSVDSTDSTSTAAMRRKQVSFKATATIIEYERYLLSPQEEKEMAKRIKKFGSGQLRQRLKELLRVRL